ncbi:hypothetical protein [Streptomyces drozdowiczii]|uniref:Uncharacterized protein n=1 Tax=Streptomyces drozdowiczii TaxID=202862 RepID=A0ABY6PMW0_9ACTN|nr:hypothetical protein [Streptomyces drozdowiczii]MCX0247054.1 hypothetical protein [Streptomyces drozdowiczii]UZK53510.1 hypothetical protein NEH16_04575 [Streptomyces drozdowiczii]
MSASRDEAEPGRGTAAEGPQPPSHSLAHKLKSLMAQRKDARGRAYVSRTLSQAVEDLPDPPATTSFALIAKLAGGQQDNPTIKTVMALCQALGDVPPAHLLPHPGYDDLAALEAFEDPLARRLLVLLGGLPESEVRAVIAHLEDRRRTLGLPAVPDDGSVKPKRPRRRRTETEAAQYAADALEGL